MAVYIVKEGKKFTIITVRPELEESFQADYAGKILASGNSTMQVLLQFEQLPDHVKYPDQYPDQEESSQ
jgi:hypothetical protein